MMRSMTEIAQVLCLFVFKSSLILGIALAFDGPR